MNQNDMQRYYWRTGQRWSADDPFDSKPKRLTFREVIWLTAALAVTMFGLALMR